MTSVKRKVLSIGEKVQIIHDIENGVSNVSICKKLNLSSSTVSTIWKKREDIIRAFQENKVRFKKLRMSDKNDLDETLFKWFKLDRNSNIPINGLILKKQAQKFARELGYSNFTCSNGWIDRFKKRHEISFVKISDKPVDTKISEDWIVNVWNNVKEDYHENDIFNIDETGVFYKLTPDKTLKFKGKKCTRGQLSAERVTILISANMSGTEKRKLLVIGKYKNLRCFKNIKNLPVKYVLNKKSWITSEIFENELHNWDLELRKNKRNVLLLVENCPSHCPVLNLTNIKLLFFPSYVTSILQPLNQSVIKSFKYHFRKLLILKFIHSTEKGLSWIVSFLEAIRLMSEAWDAITQNTIRNCFKKLSIHDKVSDENEEFLLSTWLKDNNLHLDITNIDDYMVIDNQVTTSESSIEEENISQLDIVQNSSEDEEEEDEDEINIVSSTEAQSALHTLSLFYETNEVNSDFFSYLCKIKNIVNDFHLTHRKR